MVKKEPLECEYMVDWYKGIPSSELLECPDSQIDINNWQSASKQGIKCRIKEALLR